MFQIDYFYYGQNYSIKIGSEAKLFPQGAELFLKASSLTVTLGQKMVEYIAPPLLSAVLLIN